MIKDLTGQRFLRLVVLSRAGLSKNRTATWNCRCDCGNEKIIIGLSLRHGKTRSCGCYSRDRTIEHHTLPPGEARRRAVLATYKRTANLKKHCWELTDAQFNRVIYENCRYCGALPLNGIDRVDNAIGYTLKNSAPCCRTCNYAKNKMSLHEFKRWVKRVAENLQKGRF
jgi:hypothetical protein